MKRIVLSAFAVLAVCAVPILIAQPLQAAPPASNVVVVNGPGQPVPVAVGNPVSIAGTVPVTLGAPVSVAGTVLTAPAGNPTRVSQIGILSIAPGDKEDRQTIYTVPAGKRLVVESESVVLQATDGVKAQVTMSAFNSGTSGLFYAVLPQVDRGFWDGQGEMFEGSSAIPMSLDAGQPLQARVWLNTDTLGGSIRAEIGFSGYLVDAP